MDLFDKTVLEKIGHKILDKRETIAVAESVTCGLLQFALSNIPDASTFLQGGIVTYNIGQKFKHLNVEPIHALKVNCVSQKVADQMGFEVTRLFASDWGIAITGYASPNTESKQKLFAYYAIVYKSRIKAKGKIIVAKQTSHYDQICLRKYLFNEINYLWITIGAGLCSVPHHTSHYHPFDR
jgi:nicotinamide-nucleotide amidase